MINLKFHWVVSITLLIFLLPTSNIVYGLSPMVNPDCFIEGEILDVNFAETVDYSEPNLPGPSYPDRFIFNVLINESILSTERPDSPITCDELYPRGEEIEIYIPASEVLDENDFIIGEMIEGEVANMFGAHFTEYSIHPAIILPDPDPIDAINTEVDLKERFPDVSEEIPNGAESVVTQTRNQVADSVQELLQTTDWEGGIGERIREIARTLRSDQEELEESLENVIQRRRAVRFLIGPKYNEIENVERILGRNSYRIEELREIKGQLTDDKNRELLSRQITSLENINSEINGSLIVAKGRFSLFGWFFRLF